MKVLQCPRSKHLLLIIHHVTFPGERLRPLLHVEEPVGLLHIQPHQVPSHLLRYKLEAETAFDHLWPHPMLEEAVPSDTTGRPTAGCKVIHVHLFRLNLDRFSDDVDVHATPRPGKALLASRGSIPRASRF